MNSKEKDKQIEEAQKFISKIAKSLGVCSELYTIDQSHGAENRSITTADVREDINPLLSAICHLVTLTPGVARISKIRITTIRREESTITNDEVKTNSQGIQIGGLLFYLKCGNPIGTMEKLVGEFGGSDKGFRRSFSRDEREFRAEWVLGSTQIFFFDLDSSID